jgi:hypothetical protein
MIRALEKAATAKKENNAETQFADKIMKVGMGKPGQSWENVVGFSRFMFSLIKSKFDYFS